MRFLADASGRVRSGKPTFLNFSANKKFPNVALPDLTPVVVFYNGEQLWQARLPAGGQATPMSYAADGKQYVVIAAGGHGGLGTKTGDYVVAYSLDSTAKQ